MKHNMYLSYMKLTDCVNIIIGNNVFKMLYVFFDMYTEIDGSHIGKPYVRSLEFIIK